MRLTACGGAAQPARIDPRENVERPFTFDPAEHGIGDVRPEVEEVLRQLRPAAAQGDTQVVAVPVRTDTTWTMIAGYRIQIFTSTTRELAEDEAVRARETFPQDSVYILFQTPWHRVRIGDFPTRQEAEEKLNEAKEKGYRDPFWVRSQIRVMNR